MQALRGTPITLYGDGKQTRSFCYIEGQVEALIRLMDSTDDFTGPVNLGNPIEFTILELAQHVLRLVGSDAELIFMPLPQDDPRKHSPDITLAKSVLGWQPTIALDAGLERTIAYFREQFPST